MKQLAEVKGTLESVAKHALRVFADANDLLVWQENGEWCGRRMWSGYDNEERKKLDRKRRAVERRDANAVVLSPYDFGADATAQQIAEGIVEKHNTRRARAESTAKALTERFEADTQDTVDAEDALAALITWSQQDDTGAVWSDADGWTCAKLCQKDESFNAFRDMVKSKAGKHPYGLISRNGKIMAL